jgi:glycerol-3-phosphate acyltransferase PlsY
MMQLLIVISGYLIGSLNFAYFAGYILKGIDLRQHGNGNLGATNTNRVLGYGPGVIVLILDVTKGAAAVWLANWLVNEYLTGASTWWLPLAAGLAAIAGHNWPFYLRFKGGKGVATALGVMLMMYPIALLLALFVGILIITWTKYVSLGSMIGATLVPLFIFIFDGEWSVHFWFSVIIALLVIVRHISNIKRLIQGNENKIKFKKNPGGGS